MAAGRHQVIFGDKAQLNYTTEEAAQAAVDAATSASTGERKLVHKKRSHSQVAASTAQPAATKDNSGAGATSSGPAPKRQRAKRVQRCGECHTCLNRKLRKPCKCVPVLHFHPLRTALTRPPCSKARHLTCV